MRTFSVVVLRERPPEASGADPDGAALDPYECLAAGAAMAARDRRRALGERDLVLERNDQLPGCKWYRPCALLPLREPVG
jgi:hypothetical protein